VAGSGSNPVCATNFSRTRGALRRYSEIRCVCGSTPMCDVAIVRETTSTDGARRCTRLQTVAIEAHGVSDGGHRWQEIWQRPMLGSVT